MESIKSSLKITEESIGDKQSFLNHVFYLNEKDKCDLMNVMQYMVLGIIPLILVLKFMKHFVPPEDPEKGSIELVVEVLLQLTVIFVSFYFIHRIITFIPTYSKMNYPDFSFIYVILPTLLILFTMQTKLGTKINTINDRLFNKLGLDTEVQEETVEEEKKSNKKTKEVAKQQQSQDSGFSHPYSGPNFDNMYLETTTPLQNANNPTQMPTGNSVNNYNQPGGDMIEPMAANDFGGIGGASSFY